MNKSIVGVFFVLLFLGMLGVIIFNSNISENLNLKEINEVTVGNIGINLFSNYLLPFEILAIALTGGVIGAIIFTFKNKEQTL